MRWFQYKPGVVGETQRVTHCERSADDGELRSCCRRTFDPELVEDTAEPGVIPEDGQARPCAPCIPCLMLVMAATDIAEDATPITEIAVARGALPPVMRERINP